MRTYGRGGACPARSNAADSYQLPAKKHQPIASVAALTAQPLAALPPYGFGVPLAGSERPVGTNNWYAISLKWYVPPNYHCEANSILTPTCTKCRCSAGAGCPLPTTACAVGDSTHKFAAAKGGHYPPLQTQSAFTFLTAACTNCKYLPEIATGAKRPRNDKSGAFTILTMACTRRRCSAGSGMPLPYNAHYIGIVK